MSKSVVSVSEKHISSKDMSIFPPKKMYRIEFPVQDITNITGLSKQFHPYKVKLRRFFQQHCRGGLNLDFQEFTSIKGQQSFYVLQVVSFGSRSFLTDLIAEVETWEY